MPIEDWIAPEPELFTAVVQPVFIERKLLPSLIPYHPRPVETTPMLFRLEKASDDAGDYAKFVTLGNKWDESWLELLDAMRLRIAVDEYDNEFLLDDAPHTDKLGATDLVPSRWRIERSVDFKNQEVFQEIIDWRNIVTGDTGFSIYSWIPY